MVLRLRHVCAVLAQAFVCTYALADGIGAPQLRISSELSVVPAPRPTSSAALSSASFVPVAFARPCAEDPAALSRPLQLADVLERILCRSPRMQQALATISEQYAGIILAEQAQKPRLSANADLNIAQSPATTLLSATRARTAGAGVSLNWVLFDFGAGDANLRAARSQWTAALASQSSAQLAQISDGLRLYAETLRNQARLQSLQDAEKAARLSLEIASGRHALQVGSLADKLQAQSALAQTQLELARSQGQWKTSRGNLAVAMGLPVQFNVQLAAVDQAIAAPALPDLDSQLDQVLQDHPKLQAARAEVEALQARLEQTKAQDKGTVSLNTGIAINQGLGGTSGREAERSSNIGIQANIPLLDSRSQNARQTQVAAQISSRQAQITILERELQTELWQTLQQLQSEKENLKASESLLSAAKQGHEVALGRYQAGIGSMLELLNAQSLLSQAIFQRTDADIALMQARLRLSLASIHLDSRFKN